MALSDKIFLTNGITVWYSYQAMEEVFFLCPNIFADNMHIFTVECCGHNENNKYSGGGSCARKNYIGMYRV